MNTTNRVKQHHIVPDSFEAITLKLSMVFPSTDPVFENWSFYSETGLYKQRISHPFQPPLTLTIWSMKLLPDRISSPILPVIYLLISATHTHTPLSNWVAVYIFQNVHFGRQSRYLVVILALQVVQVSIIHVQCHWLLAFSIGRGGRGCTCIIVLLCSRE